MKKFLGNYASLLLFITLLGISIVFVVGILQPSYVALFWGTREKTIWNLVELLLVPLVLALGGYLFNQAQQKQNLEFIEAQNETQRKIAIDRDQEQTLQNYLDKMGELLLERKLSVTKDKVILNLARSRTLTTLRSLNNSYSDIDGRGRNRRKGSLVRFLYEVNLISGAHPVISLRNANLEYAYMHSGEFFQVNFKDTYLKEADFRKANLQEAILINAYLPGARLNDANLNKANLTNANMQNANLLGANLDDAILDGADLKGAIMPDGIRHV